MRRVRPVCGRPANDCGTLAAARGVDHVIRGLVTSCSQSTEEARPDTRQFAGSSMIAPKAQVDAVNAATPERPRLLRSAPRGIFVPERDVHLTNSENGI